MSTIDDFLSRLTFVKKTGDGKWIARCPAHNDATPSLSIRQLHDLRVLIHCHAGCAWDAILKAVGLPLDAFSANGNFKPLWRDKDRLDHSDLVLMIAESERQAGRKLSKQDLEAERRAFLKSKGAL